MPPALPRNGSDPLKSQGAEKPMRRVSSVSPNVGTKKVLNWESGDLGHLDLTLPTTSCGGLLGEGETSKVKVGRKLSSLSSIHAKESSNICLHSSNDGELTSFETSLLALTTGC